MAFILISCFILLAVVVRALLQYKLTGSHGLRPANPKTQPLAALSGLLLIGSFALAAVLALFSTVGGWQPRLDIPQVLDFFFFTVGLTGIAVVLLAQWQMGDAWRIGVDPNEKTGLITVGLYRRCRNPIYFGILLFWLGFSGSLPDPWVWFLACLSWCSIEVIVRQVEEPYLKRLHGEQYKTYCAQTNRYFLV